MSALNLTSTITRDDPARAIAGQIAALTSRYNNPETGMEARAVAAAQGGRAAYWTDATYHQAAHRRFCSLANFLSLRIALEECVDRTHYAKTPEALLATLIPLNTLATVELEEARWRAAAGPEAA